MSSRDRPHQVPPVPTDGRAQTGLRTTSQGAEGEANSTARSGEYRAVGSHRTVQPNGANPSDERLTPTEPLLTAGLPLPSLQPRAATQEPSGPGSIRPRALSNPAIERPYASLSLPPPSRRDTGPRVGTDPAARPVEGPPSARRPLSAAPQRRLGSCALHGVALSPSGDCVMCKREAEKRNSARWSLITLVIVLVVALVAGLVLAQ